MLLAFILAYLGITVLIGFWAARKVRNTQDFMLAGRSLPIILSTSALFATWFGSETVFGASSEFLKGGLYAVIEDPFGAALCLFLFGLFFARRLYKMNLLTLGDLFRIRFGRKVELAASICLVPSYFGYAAGQFVALGLILNVVAGLPVWMGIVLCAVIVTLYTFKGGMWAISVTDFVQSIVIIVGLVVLAVVLTSKAGGMAAVMDSVAPSQLKFFPEFKFNEVVTYLAAWSVLGLGSIPSQDVFQRVMSSGSPRVAVRSCYYSAFLYLTVALIPLFIGLCITKLYRGEFEGDTQLAIPQMVLIHTSLPLQVLFFGSLLSAVLSTTSSSILAPAAILSENILKPILRKATTDSQLLLMTRVSVLIFSACATGMAIVKSDIYSLVAGSSILSLVSLLVPMVGALYWRLASPAGAVLSMVMGLLTWGYFELFPIAIPGLVPAVLVSLLFMLLGSYFWPAGNGKPYDKD